VYEELEGFAHAIRKHLQHLLGEEVTESLGAKASASKMFSEPEYRTADSWSETLFRLNRGVMEI